MEYASVNTVYQNSKRQAAKQEQGFITPADFNYYAPLVQQQEVESQISKYKLYLANKYRYLEYTKDSFEGIEQIADNLRPLEVFDKILTKSGDVFPFPNDYMMYIDINVGDTPVTLLESYKFRNYIRSRDGTITTAFPVGILQQKDIKVLPFSIGALNLSYYKQPQGVDTSGNKVTGQPKFAYQTVNGLPVFNASSSVNFELPKHIEPKLVERVVSMVAINNRDQALYQMNESEQRQNNQENR